MAPTLGYWKIRGLAQSIRFMLFYKGVEFEDKMYEQGDAPDYSREEWLKEKFNLGLELPNLPYYIDDEVKITETSAIINHIVRKYGLGGKTEAATARADMIYSWHSGQRMQVVQTVYNPEFESKREGLVKTFPEKLETISKLLGDQKFLTGDEVTYVDFVIYDLMNIYRHLSEGCITQESLIAFMKRIEAMPELTPMFENEKYKNLPFNNKVAKWGGSPMQ